MFKLKSKFMALVLVLALTISLSAGLASAQQPPSEFADYYNRMEMFDPGFQPRDYIEEIVYNLTSRFGIRRMGTQNEFNAVKYIESEFTKLGYTDVTVGDFPITNTITIGTLRFNDGGPDIHGNTSTTPYDFSGAKLVNVGTHLSYSIPAGTTGDIVIAVLFENAAVAVATVNTIVAELGAANPAVNIVGVVTARSGAMTQTTNSIGETQFRNTNERTVPTAINPTGGLPTITLPRAFYIQAIERADAFANMHRHVRGGTGNPTNGSWSVYAVKPAATPDPDLVIVVTAHIDTVLASPGASDNAGGVASVMENARLFFGQDTGNIEMVFAALGAEEGSSPSFAGSAWVADQMIDRYGRDIIVNFNCDMFGSPNRTSGNSPIDINMINIHNAVGGTGANTTFGTVIHNLPAWLMLSNADDVPMAPGITNYRLNRFGSTDHVAFQNRNIDALNVAITSPAISVEAEYHTAEDTMKCNWAWERCVNAIGIVTAGLEKAVAVQTSKVAKFEITELGEVILNDAQRQFNTYSKGIQARFTNDATSVQYDLTFEPGAATQSLPAGSYTISNVVGSGRGVADVATREELDFSAVMEGRLNAAVPTFSIKGPDTVTYSEANSPTNGTASYTVSVEKLPTSSLWVKMKITVDSRYFNILNSSIPAGWVNLPAFEWVDAGGGMLEAIVNLTRSSVPYGDFDIFSFDLALKDLTAFLDPDTKLLPDITTAVKLEVLEFGSTTIWLNFEYGNDTATTKIVQGYSRFDINKDGDIDGRDIAAVMDYYMIRIIDPAWDATVALCDVNGDGRVDIIDLVLIYANFS